EAVNRRSAQLAYRLVGPNGRARAPQKATPDARMPPWLWSYTPRQWCGCASERSCHVWCKGRTSHEADTARQRAIHRDGTLKPAVGDALDIGQQGIVHGV